jgi:hypothetical protein
MKRIRRIVMGMMILARGETTHPQTQFWVVSQEHLVKIGSHLWTSGDSGEAPAVQLACKTSEFGSLEILYQDLRRKLLLLVNDERPPMRQPRYRIRILIVRQDFH